MTDQMSQAGATPAAGGATPPAPGQPAPGGATPPQGTDGPAGGATPPAAGSNGATSTSYPDGLGDAGKRALDAERAAAEAAEARARKAEEELDKLRKASQTEAEKALEQAKREGWTQAADLVRRSEVRRALTAAGCRFVDLAAKADEFAGLEVTEQGAVKDLDKAIERFRNANPDAFGAGGRPADYGGGPRGQAAGSGIDMNSLIRRAAGRS